MERSSRMARKAGCVAIGLAMLGCIVDLGARAQQGGANPGSPAQSSDSSPQQPTKPPAKPSKFEEVIRRTNANTITIIASSALSTYTRFAEDIQNVLDDVRPNGLRILPMLGRGGGQNFQDVLFLRDIDAGTTDADYLRFFKQKDPALFGNIDRQIRYVTKLFNAEFHVLAPAAIKCWSDLNGKKVNFSKRLSVTSMAADTIFRILNISVQPTFFDDDLAVEKMRNGEIAATVRMTGAPDGDYANIRPIDKFHLVPLGERKVAPQQFADLTNIYLPATLTHEQYPQLIPEGEEIATVAGSIVLAVYNWPETSERYQKLANFVQKFFDRINKFHDPSRHPKWRDVNLAASVPGWTRFKPAQDWLDAHRLTSGRPTEPLTGREKELFEEFVKWRNSRKGAGAAQD
jgi:TRAP-type uncharacterized transport system substrate-binding protein